MIKKTLLGISIIIGIGISYTYASFPTIGSTGQLDEENTCFINSNLSFECTTSENVLARKRSTSTNNPSTMNGIFWTDGGIGVFHNHYNNGVLNTGLTRQGIMTGGFHICSGNTTSAVNNNNSFLTNCIPGFTTIGDLNYNSLITKLTSKEPIYRRNAQAYGGVTLSLIYDDFYFTIMIDGYGGKNNLNGNLNENVNFGFGNSIDYENINRNNNNIRYKPNKKNKTTNTNTNNNYICPTIGQLMRSMGENYNTGLCYNNNTYFNGTNIEQTEKEDIFTIFDDNYENYTNRISIYRNNCKAPATTENCGRAFSGEIKKLSIISNAMNSKVDEKNLRNYCNLGLNYDPNATTCTTNPEGIIKEEYTTEEQIQNIINNGAIAIPYTTGDNQNNVLNALNKCENGDRECYVNNRNFIDSLKNIYGKITGLFKERNGVNGIIPNYILRITFLTILFTVIFKK